MSTGSLSARDGFRGEQVLFGRAAELAVVDRLLEEGRRGSRVLVLRGGRGVGKTALLDRAAARATGFRIVRVPAVRAEADLGYSGLQLLCSSLLGGVDRLPPDRREALETAVGLRPGPPPDRFGVGVATLDLLTRAAEEQPLLCLVDDAHWLDRSSARVLAFVARRLGDAPMVLLLAERSPAESGECGEFGGIPVHGLAGLPPGEAAGLLGSLVGGHVQQAVVERMADETRGNPHAVREAARTVSAVELAGYGIPDPGTPPDPGAPGPASTPGGERLEGLGRDGRLLLVTAAAEPLGDPGLLWRAVAHLGILPGAREQVEAEGLVTFGARVVFDDPRSRHRVYRAASPGDRRAVHQALAAATDPVTDPDRRVWHLARAAEAPDDALGDELTRCAQRALERGGLAGQAAFLEQAALLTDEPVLRAERALTAAAAGHRAGAHGIAARMLGLVELGPPDALRSARLTALRAYVDFVATHGNEAAGRLLSAARGLGGLETEQTGRTLLDALGAAMVAGRLGSCPDVAEVAHAVRGHAALTGDPLMTGLAARCTDGYAAAVGPLRYALAAACGEGGPERGEGGAGGSGSGEGGSGPDEAVPGPDEALPGYDEEGPGGRPPLLICLVAPDLWDDASWDATTRREVRRVRQSGADVALPHALCQRALARLHEGDLDAAEDLVGEVAGRAPGHPSLSHAVGLLAAWRGSEDSGLKVINEVQQAACARGDGMALSAAGVAEAVLHNGLRRYDEAFAAARMVAESDELAFLGWSLVELIEAAVRCGESGAAARAVERLAERTRLCGTDWALGVEAGSRALLHDGPRAEELYAEAVARLGRCRITTRLARTQLLYGEWLRRQGRRVDARAPLHEAQRSFLAMGASAFAERARRELLATGRQARGRVVEAHDRLTLQETQIALLARDGLSNPEIATRLSISARTVEYHLRKVFRKLEIASRLEIPLALPDAARES